MKSNFCILALILCLAATTATWGQMRPIGTIRGTIMRGSVPYAYKSFYLIRIQADDSSIDTSGNIANGTPFRATIGTDSSGYFEVANLPLRPSPQPTRYLLGGSDCNGNPSPSLEVIFLSDTLSGVRYNMCPALPDPCALSAAYSWGAPPSGPGLTIAFRLFSVPNDPTYLSVWSFGDGSLADTLPIPNVDISHTYAAPGLYNVCHTLSIPGQCVRRICLPVRVGALATVAGSVLANNVCLQDSTLIELFGVTSSSYGSFVNQTGTCQYYGNVGPGQYLIRATPLAPSLIAQGYVPTYYPSSVFWDSTNVVTIQDSGLFNINLQRLDSSFPQGPQRVRVTFAGEGNPVQSPMGSAGMRPFYARNARVFLRRPGGNLVRWARAQAGVPVEFTNLPPGQYTVSSDLPFLMAQDQMADLRTSQSADVSYTATAGGVVATVTSVRGKLGQALQAYPNPATSAVQLTLPGAKGAATVRMMAADGRTVRMIETMLIENGLSLSLEGLDAGLYMVTLSQADGATATARLQLTR